MRGRPAPSSASRLCQNTEAPTPAISAARAPAPAEAAVHRGGHRVHQRVGVELDGAIGGGARREGHAAFGAGQGRAACRSTAARAELVPTSSAMTSIVGGIFNYTNANGETSMTTIRVLSPQGEARAATHAVPSLPQSFRGLTVGFLDNKKHNFDRLVLEMGELMVARWGVARVVHRQKANAATPRRVRSWRRWRRSATSSSPAPPTEGPARRGVSTTRWKWRRRARPPASSRPRYSRSSRSRDGGPGRHRACRSWSVQHPLGGEKPEGVSRRAAQAVEQLASLLGQP